MTSHRLRVAIADDDRSMLRVLSQLLHNSGHEVVVSAENGRTLVEECRQARPDVVITDNLMPDMCGVDAAAEIHACDGTPVILLSAYSGRDFVLDAEQSHVLLYLVKPISQQILEAALSTVRSRACSDDDDENSLEEPEATPFGVLTPASVQASSHFAPLYRQVSRHPK